MTEFGANGEVLAGEQALSEAARPAYALPGKRKVKRVVLAIFLTGLAACIGVAIIGAVLLFTLNFLGAPVGAVGTSEGVIGGIMFAFLASALNWFVFYLTIPAAWLVLGFSLGMMPRRGITKRAAYFRWGIIWGVLLVAGTASIFAGLLVNQDLLAGIGGFIGGVIVGAPAGAICAWLFLAIVRPAEQIGEASADVF